MIEYPKISGPYKRFVDGDKRNQLDPTRWTKPEFELLKDTPFVWTEKIDGTNIRIGWDGHKPSFAGRTDRAQLPGDLVNRLTELFTEELFEQEFGSTEVTLFGEGYGAGIQKGGGNYGPTKEFILFDVLIGDLWLEPTDVLNIAVQLGINVVPTFFVMSPLEAIDTISRRLYRSSWPKVEMEGIVGTVANGLLDRRGNRIQMKVKLCDFPEV